MITRNLGEWWNQPTRPMLKYKAGAFAESDVDETDLATSAVTCSKIADGHVVSQKAATNLVSRTVTIPVGRRTASSSGGWSTGYVVWRPSVPVQVTGIHVMTQGVYEHACNDSMTFFGNAGTCLGDVRYCTAGSTAPAVGVRTAMGNLTGGNLSLAAATDLVLSQSLSTCSAPPAFAVQIDYYTTAG